MLIKVLDPELSLFDDANGYLNTTFLTQVYEVELGSEGRVERLVEVLPDGVLPANLEILEDPIHVELLHLQRLIVHVPINLEKKLWQEN